MDDAKSYIEVLNGASSFLKEQGKDEKAILPLFLERKSWNKTDWLLHMRESIPAKEYAQVKKDMALLMQDIPLQYIVGYTEFYGEKFFVSSDTLIPRPETEELVELCLHKNTKSKVRVLDIGTGSGVIAIMLKKKRPEWQVTAIDISSKALEVAKRNADFHQVSIDFLVSDVWSNLSEDRFFDIIISNPPYISWKEWEDMDLSVKKYEPQLALFAENNGLALYQKIVLGLKKYLHTKGQVFLEIGYQQGESVRQMCQLEFPEKEVKIFKDLSGLDRIISIS